MKYWMYNTCHIVEYHKSDACQNPPDDIWNITSPIHVKAHQTLYRISQVQYMLKHMRHYI